MTLQVLEYEIKQDGEYTNYNVKKLTLPKQQPPSQLAQSQTQKGPQRDNTLTMYVSYVKDMMVQLLAAEHHEYAPLSIEELAKLVINTGKMMHGIAQEPARAPEKPQKQEGMSKPAPETESEPERETPPISAYDVPF